MRIHFFQVIKAAFFLITFSLWSNDAAATHAMGADLTYRCLGNNQYEVTYSFYRDCSGITPSNPMTLDIFNPCTGTAIPSVNMPLVAGYPIEITPNCTTATTTCNGGSYTGVQEWVYRTVITLPAGCNEWRISHTESARNGAITTGPANLNLYVYSSINNANGLCNNSPTFTNRPVVITCLGQTFTFNHGAIDPDGDSLVYTLMTPLQGWGNNVPYLTGFSGSNFIQSSPPIFFNGTTGDIRITPSSIEVTVFAVLVSEYRNGVLIGQVQRDIQLSVENCTNMLPQLLGINGTPSYNTTACAGQPLCFNISSVDTNANDITTITWNNAIPGGTLTTTGTRRDSARFCWTPTLADISPTPHCFTATVRDNACPYRGLQVYTYCIRVNGVIAVAGPDQTIACNAVTNLIGSALLGNGTYNYSWNPGAVNNDTLMNATIGTYVLTVTSAGCTSRDTVRVQPGVGGSLAAFASAANCQNRNVQFTDQSSSTGTTITSWSWSFGDGGTSTQQNPSHTYAANGTYNVQLIVNTAAGCTDTIVQQVVVTQNIPTAAFATANVCQGATVNFTDQSVGTGITSWLWNFGDAGSGSNTSTSQSPTHLYSGPGTYNVNLLVTNSSGCQSQISQSVTVYANPTVTLNSTQICAGAQATLSVPSTFAGYNWSNGGTGNSITVSPPSTTGYSITVTDANNCTATASATVTVNPIPVATAGNNQNICQGQSATLNGGGGGTYVWNPGNLTGQSVTVSPSSSTTYVVTVTSAASCSATASVTVNVNVAPQVNVSDDAAICAGSSITLQVVNGTGNLNWTPGNLNTASITVSPAVTTTYYLTVTDGIGCAGSDSVRVVVNPLPDASFSQSGPVCLTAGMNFTDQSQIATGVVNQWNWFFGDNQSSTAQNPSHIYNAAGNYIVKLIVRSAAGCTDSVDGTVIVNSLPVADAGVAQSICPGENVTLNGSGGTIYSWSPGGQSTGSIQVSPSSTTNYILTVTDANGCQDTDDVTVTVNPAVVADAGTNVEVCIGESVTLQANGGNDYLWTPGNVNTSQYNFTPAASGTYTVLVTNSFGCTGTDQVDVIVNPLPVAAFTGNNTICLGNPITLNDQSVVNTGSIVSWNWTFGNGGTSSQQNPSVNYTSAGTYNIQLSVTTDAGCQDDIQLTQIINANPVAAFTSTNVCENEPVSLSSISTISDGSALAHSWTLSDGFASANTSFTHQFASAGSYTGTLIVTSVNGCTDQVTQPINVFPLPQAMLTTEPVCVNSSAIINDLSMVSSGSIQYWRWDFGDGNGSNAPNPVHIYTAEGNYRINLYIETEHGCRDSNYAFIRVMPRPIVDFVGQNVCFGFEVNFTNLSSAATGDITQYNWAFGDGGNSNDTEPVHIYNAPGWFAVTLTATSDSGCSTTRTIPNAVNIFPPPSAEFTDNAGEASDIYPIVNFYNQTVEPGASYWSFGDSTFSTEYSPLHQYEGPGVYEVQLVTISNNGCVDTTVRLIEIRPTSTVYIPNAFTPNGDQRNDFFQIYSSNIKSLEVAVYDRWGLKIVEWDNPSGSWDGRINGNPAQADVYVYRVVTVDARDKREVRLGHVTLVR